MLTASYFKSHDEKSNCTELIKFHVLESCMNDEAIVEKWIKVPGSWVKWWSFWCGIPKACAGFEKWPAPGSCYPSAGPVDDTSYVLESECMTDLAVRNMKPIQCRANLGHIFLWDEKSWGNAWFMSDFGAGTGKINLFPWKIQCTRQCWNVDKLTSSNWDKHSDPLSEFFPSRFQVKSGKKINKGWRSRWEFLLLEGIGSRVEQVNWSPVLHLSQQIIFSRQCSRVDRLVSTNCKKNFDPLCDVWPGGWECTWNCLWISRNPSRHWNR